MNVSSLSHSHTSLIFIETARVRREVNRTFNLMCDITISKHNPAGLPTSPEVEVSQLHVRHLQSLLSL